VHELPGLLRRDVRAVRHVHVVHLHGLHRHRVHVVCDYIRPREHELQRLRLRPGTIRRVGCLIFYSIKMLTLKHTSHTPNTCRRASSSSPRTS
jgi:hypothetical protein